MIQQEWQQAGVLEIDQILGGTIVIPRIQDISFGISFLFFFFLASLCIDMLMCMNDAGDWDFLIDNKYLKNIIKKIG